MAAPRPHSRLPHFLATLYGLAIVYASLQPFAPWMAPPPATPFYLFATWPPKWIRYDVVTNFLAYVPFGFFVALVPQRMGASARVATALATAALLSFTMEWLQTYLPTRDASVADLLSNSAGAATGSVIAVAFARSTAMKETIVAMRERWFLGGKIGDLGLALLAIWLAVQANPGIPLFAAMYDLVPRVGDPVTVPDVAATVVEAAHSAFQLVGVGLFLALLLRQRRLVAGAVLLLVGAALIVKGVAAVVLLRPAAWENWLTPGVFLGVAAGSLLLSLAIWLPRPAQVTLAAIALLSSLLATVFAPELVYARAPMGLFGRPYGLLLNFNGLTHTVLLLWPAVASVFLLALAGRPGWGEPA